MLLEQHRQGTNFSLVNFVRTQSELCRVLVRATDFPWLKRYAPLIERNLLAEKEGVAGHEIFLNYNGVPCRLIPRAAQGEPNRLSKLVGLGLQLAAPAPDERPRPAERVGGSGDVTVGVVLVLVVVSISVVVIGGVLVEVPEIFVLPPIREIVPVSIRITPVAQVPRAK